VLPRLRLRPTSHISLVADGSGRRSPRRPVLPRQSRWSPRWPAPPSAQAAPGWPPLADERGTAEHGFQKACGHRMLMIPCRGDAGMSI
jgi:hypothetical protein